LLGVVSLELLPGLLQTGNTGSANGKHWFVFGLIFEVLFIILLSAYLMIDGLNSGLLDRIGFEMCVAFVLPIAIVCFIPSMILAFVGYHLFNKNITNKEKLQ
jgi:hypothetical protein